MRKLTKKQHAYFLGVLTAEAEALTGTVASLDTQDAEWARLATSDQRSRDSYEGDFVTVERVLLAQLAESTVAGTDAVHEALRKLKDGTYGRCDACGKDIPLERLEARPRATRCVPCS